MSSIILNLVGDVMLGELIENFKCGVRSKVDRKGIDPFEFCTEEFARADLNIANLECVLTDLTNKSQPFSEILRCPKDYVSLLSKNKIHLVNTANNHALDHGVEALNDTISNLHNINIQTIGYGTEELLQRKPLVIEKNGISLAFFGFNLANFSDEKTDQRISEIVEILKAVKGKFNCTVVSMHWAEEYTDVPRPKFVELAKRLFTAGCDIFHGHHSHRLQGIVFSRGKLFAPSLGNFVFDDNRDANLLTGVLQVKITKLGVENYRLIPYKINRDFQPVPFPAGESQIAVLNQKLHQVWNCQDKTESQRWTSEVDAAVSAGHRHNRLRMRILMLSRIHNYFGHLKPMINMALGRTGRMFSVSEMEA